MHAANVYRQKVTCLTKKKNRDYVGKWKVPRVRCMTDLLIIISKNYTIR